MAGLQPKEAQYGDQTTLRRMGMKMSPETGTPTLFNPQGGRPPEAPGAPVPGGNQTAALPPAEAVDIAPEHQSLYDRALELSNAARSWAELAATPIATPKIKRTAAALKEAARLAILDARAGTPWVKGL